LNGHDDWFIKRGVASVATHFITARFCLIVAVTADYLLAEHREDSSWFQGGAFQCDNIQGVA